MTAADAKDADSTPPVIGPIPDPVRSASPTATPKLRRLARNPTRPWREPTTRLNRPARDERTSSSLGGTVLEAMLLRGRQQLLLDLGTQLVFGQDSRHPVHHLPLCREEYSGRHALDGEKLHRGGIDRIGKRVVNPQLRVELHRVLVRSQSGEGPYVDPDDDDLPGQLSGNLFKPRHFHLAGRAIPRPEVQDYRLSLLEDLLKACLFATQDGLALVSHDAKISTGTDLSAVAWCGMDTLKRQDGNVNDATAT